MNSTNLNSHSTLPYITGHFIDGCEYDTRSGIHCAAHAAQFLCATAGATTAASLLARSELDH